MSAATHASGASPAHPSPSGSGAAGDGPRDGAAGLRARPAPAPQVVAAVAAALDQLLAEAASAPVAAPPTDPAVHGAWRFSGRWWALPPQARRPRPWGSSGTRAR